MTGAQWDDHPARAVELLVEADDQWLDNKRPTARESIRTAHVHATLAVLEALNRLVESVNAVTEVLAPISAWVEAQPAPSLDAPVWMPEPLDLATLRVAPAGTRVRDSVGDEWVKSPTQPDLWCPPGGGDAHETSRGLLGLSPVWATP